MKAMAASTVSLSMVSMRFLVSGPVSSMVCLPTLPKRGSTVSSSVSVAKVCSTPRGPNFARNSGILRIVLVLGLLLGVQVIEIAEELVEAVQRRQKLVLVAEMVLAELAGGVAERLEQLGDGRILGAETEIGARQPDLRQPGAKHALAGDEGRAARGAALLAVIIGEDHAFVGDAVDVRRAIAHQALGVGADIALADIVAPDDEDVRLLVLRHGRDCGEHGDEECCKHVERHEILQGLMGSFLPSTIARLLIRASLPQAGNSLAQGVAEGRFAGADRPEAGPLRMKTDAALGYAVPGEGLVNCCIAGMEPGACSEQRETELHDAR